MQNENESTIDTTNAASESEPGIDVHSLTAEEQKAASEAALKAINDLRNPPESNQPSTHSVFPAPKLAPKPAPVAEPDSLAKLRNDFETFKRKVQKHVANV